MVNDASTGLVKTQLTRLSRTWNGIVGPLSSIARSHSSCITRWPKTASASNSKACYLHSATTVARLDDRVDQTHRLPMTHLFPKQQERNVGNSRSEALMQSWLVEACARLILATRWIDKSYRAIDRFRSALVLALASDAVLARFNCLAYGEDEAYQPGSSAFRGYVFPWEEKVVATFFPPPPARLLIGGAGGGREVLALAGRGYEVVAFEPSAALAAAMAGRAANGLNVRVYRASYEDLPRLFSARPEEPCGSLEAEADFDAAILGWGSYSHLRTEEQRMRALSSFARHVRGPILVSFYQFAAHDVVSKGTRTERIRELLKIGSGDRFSVYIGFSHDVSAPELATIAKRSGLSIVHLSEDIKDTNWPHAVLCPIDLADQIRASAAAAPARAVSATGV